MCLSTFSPLNSDNHANVETAHGTHYCLYTINDITTTLTQRMGKVTRRPHSYRAQTLCDNRYVSGSCAVVVYRRSTRAAATLPPNSIVALGMPFDQATMRPVGRSLSGHFQVRFGCLTGWGA